MYYILDTVTNKTATQYKTEFFQTAKRWAEKQNIKNCGIEEIDKPESERRYIIKEI